jgi:hypothetical protein
MGCNFDCLSKPVQRKTVADKPRDVDLSAKYQVSGFVLEFG